MSRDVVYSPWNVTGLVTRYILAKRLPMRQKGGLCLTFVSAKSETWNVLYSPWECRTRHRWRRRWPTGSPKNCVEHQRSSSWHLLITFYLNTSNERLVIIFERNRRVRCNWSETCLWKWRITRYLNDNFPFFKMKWIKWIFILSRGHQSSIKITTPLCVSRQQRFSELSGDWRCFPAAGTTPPRDREWSNNNVSLPKRRREKKDGKILFLSMGFFLIFVETESSMLSGHPSAPWAFC